MNAETTSQTPPVAARTTRSFGPGMRWIVFAGIALGVVALDQLAKLIVTANLVPHQAVEIVGDYLRIVFGQNSGALFGLFQDNALMFGIVSLAVIALIVGYHARATSSAYLTVTLGLLLGGAIGNMVDRLRLGYVVDFVDAGIGTTRFYTFNIADSAISLSILLLFIAALRPSLIEGAPSPAAGTPQPRPQRPSGPLAEGEEDPWDEDVDAGQGPGAAG
jgi:signal peptidase II